MNTSLTLTFRNRPIEIDVEFKVANLGIGAYEFWGAHGVDNPYGVDEWFISMGWWIDTDKQMTEQEVIDAGEEFEDEITEKCQEVFKNSKYNE